MRLNLCFLSCAIPHPCGVKVIREDNKFFSEIEVGTWIPLGPLNALMTVLGLFRLIPGPVTMTPAPVIGTEKLYTSAKITEIKGVTIQGDPFEFSVDKPVTTVSEKMREACLHQRNDITTMASSACVMVKMPDGRRLGSDGKSTYTEIENGFYTGPEEDIQLIVFLTPEQNYEIMVSGVKEGEYDLQVGRFDQGKYERVILEENITIIPGEINSYAVEIGKPGPEPVQFISDIASQQKIFLDTGFEVVDTVTYAGTTYHVVKYNNILPYASGIEIFSSDGSKVTDPKIAKSILTSIAWEEAAAQLKPSDIDTLRNILDTSQKIHEAVSPVASATSFVLDKIDWLENEACIGIGPFRKCAWDVVKASYPGISTLESKLKSLNTDLKEWEDASAKVSDTLPDAISGLEDLKAGKEMSPKLQTDIQKSMSAFGTLKTKTDDISSRLSGVISILSDAERSIRSAAETPVVGGFIATFADYVGDLNDKVKSLRGDAQSFSRSLSEQGSKLSSVMNAANERTNELHCSWSSRKNAPMMVYCTLGGIIAVILAILGVLMYRRRRRKTGEVGVKKEKVKKKIRIKKIELSSKEITGIIIAVAGLLLLLYSFITANYFVIGGFMIDETFGIRIIFLICMIGIGGYLTGKGATLTEDSKIIGIILTPIGLFMLCSSFIIANMFVKGEFMFDESFFIKLIFFFCMIGIGGYLTGKGVTLTDYPKITGLILTPIGAFMLLFSFITANGFVSGEYMADETFVIRIIYFICMIGIGGYLTGRGASEISKK